MQATVDRLGGGTYQLGGTREYASEVAHAIETGDRHIDTAQLSHNESDAAAGVERSDRHPDEVLIATKRWTDNLHYQDVILTATESCDRLGVDTIDLLSVRRPVRTHDPTETLPALDTLIDEKVIDDVGVSDFRFEQLDPRLEADAHIFVHQVKPQPLFQRETLRDAAREDDHSIQNWAARNQELSTAEIDRIDALEHDISVVEFDAAPRDSIGE